MAAMMQPASDSDLRQAVLGRIQREAVANAENVEVTAERGVVTLTGMVNTDSDRLAFEASVKQVSGVKAIANALRVKSVRQPSDREIAAQALNMLQSQILLPAGHIQVIVRDGRVILEGETHWAVQKMFAEAAIKRLPGITGVSNKIEIRPEAFVEGRPAQPQALATGGERDAENGALSENGEWVETGVAEAG